MHKKFFISGLVSFLIISVGIFQAARVEASPPARSCSPTNALITSPGGGSVVNGAVTVFGSAFLPNGEFRSYKLEFATAGTNAWAMIASSRSQVINGALGTWNTRNIPDGPYTLRLHTLDATGNYCQGFASPISVRKNGAPPPTSPSDDQQEATPGPTDKPGKTTSTPITQSVPTLTPAAAGPAPTDGPKIEVDLPSEVANQQATPIIPTTLRNAGQVALPVDLSGATSAIGSLMGQLGQAFVVGMQMTAGLFLVLGAVVFLRRNL